MSAPVALVTGALGTVGYNMVRHLAATGEWRVISVSRRSPAEEHGDDGGVEHVAVDLLDRRAAEAALGRLTGVTHVFFAAKTEAETPALEAERNLALLANTIEALEPAAPHLRHVSIVHGTKWYGCHLGPYKTPAREDDPRHLPPNFYYDQYDYLSRRQAGKAWTWSSLRPHTVWGWAPSARNNIINVIAAHATICRHLRLPLRFPGPPDAYRTVRQATDVGLLTRAMVWSSTSEACAGHAFNVTNGDYFRWDGLWPRIADLFEMPVGPSQQISLGKFMADKGALWAELAARHRLRVRNLSDFVSWEYGDFIFGTRWDDMSSTVKIRAFGFGEAIDSEERCLELLREYRERRLIP